MKKYLVPLLLITSFTSTTAYAAGFFSKLADYTFFSDRKSGVFVGIDQNQDETTKYTNSYAHSRIKSWSVGNEGESQFKELNVLGNENVLTYGLRFYLPMKDKKSKLNNIGLGIKGWYSSQSVDLSSVYLTTTNVETIGYEGQLYYDFLNFSTKKMNHALGLTIGIGNEIKKYNDFSTEMGYGTASSDFVKYSNIKDFQLNSLVYDISLHYTLANRFRVEFGYKMRDFGSNTQSDKGSYQYHTSKTGIVTQNATIDTTVTPSQGYYYIAYSLQF